MTKKHIIKSISRGERSLLQLLMSSHYTSSFNETIVSETTVEAIMPPRFKQIPLQLNQRCDSKHFTTVQPDRDVSCRDLSSCCHRWCLCWNLLLTPGSAGHQKHLQQKEDPESLHSGLICRKKNARPLWSETRGKHELVYWMDNRWDVLYLVWLQSECSPHWRPLNHSDYIAVCKSSIYQTAVLSPVTVWFIPKDPPATFIISPSDVFFFLLLMNCSQNSC